jgi:Zn-finger protein
MKSNCEYNPCHHEGQDCSLCYCPFYSVCPTLPSELRSKVGIAGYWLSRIHLGLPSVWACEECEFNHRPEVANLTRVLLQNLMYEVFDHVCIDDK